MNNGTTYVKTVFDFLNVSIVKNSKKSTIDISPSFIVGNSKDLMIRGSDFYAIFDKNTNLWTDDMDKAIKMIDGEVQKVYQEYKESNKEDDYKIHANYIWDANSCQIDKWLKYCRKQMPDWYHQLDEKLIFSNTELTKEDYASKTLPYAFEDSEIPNYEELISTLYSPEEREKIEWAIGSIVNGDSKENQKFVVMYGPPASGKSTILNIIQDLFKGYYSVFDSRALGSSSNAFALEAFRSNPLVAIQHDGDLSKIEDNTRLNSLVSHEEMTVNEKYKSAYTTRFKSFLFMGTNKPVKITDAKSGLLRRLIDVTPKGTKIPRHHYDELISAVKFELGGIASHCLNVYNRNPRKYDSYVPTSMLGASNDFYNFVLDSYTIFKRDDCVTLKVAWEMYNEFCKKYNVNPCYYRTFKEELKCYFKEVEDRVYIDDDSRVRNLYKGFLYSKFANDVVDYEETSKKKFIFNCTKSLFDKEFAECPAQYATSADTPTKKWAENELKLKDISTQDVHYVKVPINHIVIDFDIKDKDGKKSFELNSKAAEKWPATYAELSKSGQGIHLHYNYSGDPLKLSNLYDTDIEIKVFNGGSSLRRKLTKCNNVPIATISSGLPLKEKKMIDQQVIKDEKHLRAKIKQNLRKEVHSGTKPSVMFIHDILESAYGSGMVYDVSDMESDIFNFALHSTNHSDYCISLCRQMHFKSAEAEKAIEVVDDSPIYFFDMEVPPNMTLLIYKKIGDKSPFIRLINPTPTDIEELSKKKLVGHNCRRYDNHICYGVMLGNGPAESFEQSKKIINPVKGKQRDGFYGEAYNFSYADTLDYPTVKQSLKKWEIQLGIPHQEFDMPWDQPVPEELWDKLAEYCENDVRATEAVWNATQADFKAREILVAICKSKGFSAVVNDTTNSLTTKIIFGNDRNPQLVYTDLATGEQSNPQYQRNDILGAFPGYEYKEGKNLYMGEDVGKGGYVYAEPGIYHNVALLDIQSMHPSSILAMNCFGQYTQNFKDIYDARVFIKHEEYDKAGELLGGVLKPYLTDKDQAKQLSSALKIAINSVYGLTSASFENPFKDPRNVNNIVALRGALFMINLKHEVQSRGFTVAHIKTDSIKIPDATPEIIQFCMEYAKSYGYIFEHEATYDRMCLVNDAVYIAKYDTGEWTATGTQFQVPYVFKTLFSKEKIEFRDMCETKEVKTALYLDYDEGLPEGEHNRKFIGRVGLFTPVVSGCGGGRLVRVDKDNPEKFDAATGTKGYRWYESDLVKNLNMEDKIDISYYRALVDDAVETIGKYGDPYEFMDDDIPPFDPPYNKT